MKDVIAGLVVLEAVRLHAQVDGKVQMTEDELHAFIMEALELQDNKDPIYEQNQAGHDSADVRRHHG